MSQKQHNFLSRLQRDQRGAVAILFGLLLIPLVGMMALALDFSLLKREANIQQVAADAAALAAASRASIGTHTETELIAAAKASFHENYVKLGGQPGGPDPIITVSGGTITVTYVRAIDTALLGVFGYDTMQSGVESKAGVAVPSKLEVVMVLDYSSSMNGHGKYQAMRDAAIQLVEDLTTDVNDPGHKFALVPFARHVYASMPSDFVVGQAPGGTWTNCTMDREYPYNTQDSTPDAGDDTTKWTSSSPLDNGHLGLGPCHNYLFRNLAVMPLTDNENQVVAKLQSMWPYSGTHIALGLEMGWHVISPNLPFNEGVAYNTNDVQKVIVLLTDGRQTVAGNGPGGSSSDENAEANMQTMCAAIKAQNVRLITIGFDLKKQATKDALLSCASSNADFYDADDNSELSASFQNITQTLAGAVRLIE